MKSLKEENQELVEKFFKLINYMGNEKDLRNEFVEALRTEHRTLQQNAVRFLYEVVVNYAEKNTGCDPRNEQAVAWAKEIAAQEKKYFSFI